VNGLLEKFLSLDESQRQSIVKWAAFAAAIGPAVLILGKVVGAVGKVSGALGTAFTATIADSRPWIAREIRRTVFRIILIAFMERSSGLFFSEIRPEGSPGFFCFGCVYGRIASDDWKGSSRNIF